MTDISEKQDSTGLQAPRVLVVGPESEHTKDLIVFLKGEGLEILWGKDGEMGYNILDSTHIDVIVTELKVHRIDGMNLLSIAKKRNPEICVIVIADEANIELATEAMRQGAYDFQSKPLNLEKLKAVIDRAISHQRLVLEVTDLYERLDDRLSFRNIVGRSKAMGEVYEKIRQVAPSRATVLLCGQTGTGKELVAQAIHHNSPRKDSPFVKLSCSALSEGVIESELFGHEKGAFTGAVSPRKGRFEIADGGTLFLDEVGEITPSIQVKLLRVLQEGEFERVGGDITRKVNVRLIASTNRDLEEMIRRGEYRRDLYYRLNVVTVHLPRLRDRRDDIPLLVDVFIRDFSGENGKDITGITRGAMNILMQYDWPGNVRELKNCIEGMVVLSKEKSRLEVTDLPEHTRRSGAASDEDIRLKVGMTMRDIEKEAIKETLKHVGYNKPMAAELLGIGLRTLYRKQKEYGID